MGGTLRGFLVGLVVLPTTLWLGPVDDAGQDRKTPKLARPGKSVLDVATCGDCHEDEFEAIRGGVHAAVPSSPWLERCETCHGPGALHAEENEASQITHPALLGRSEQRALCGRCHADQIRHHGGPLPELEKAGKTCTDCHSVHQLKSETPGHGDARVFSSRAALDAVASPVGADRCAKCHVDKAASLRDRTHATLLTTHEVATAVGQQLAAAGHANWHASMSCEACHGNGSLHARDGLARWITRPDRAADGDSSCRSCHGDVDPVLFHWKDDPKPPLLASATEPLRCTSCHKVHADGDPTRLAPGLAEQRVQPTSRPSKRAARKTIYAADATIENRACLPCHREAYEVLHGTTHEELARLDLPRGQGCVSCHPGAAAHAANGGAKDLVVSLRGSDARFVAQTCNACHGGDSSVCGFSLGAHGKAEVGCLECHSPAAKNTARSRVLDANKTCASCHPGTSLSFRHANRHPIGEGLFHCSSCHDPHQPVEVGPASARRMSKKCADCHKQFRGPFVFPHHADKGEGCLACHQSHGSPNRKLLDHVRARDSCLQCHGDLPAFHDLSAGSRYQNCLNCHVKVHGSNRSRFFFR